MKVSEKKRGRRENMKQEHNTRKRNKHRKKIQLLDDFD